jgi:hypothetical protein
VQIIDTFTQDGSLMQINTNMGPVRLMQIKIKLAEQQLELVICIKMASRQD